jgi:hypothetical protein
MTAKPVSERVAAFRARRSSEGLSEVRGIFLPPDLHPRIKEMAAKLRAKELRKAGV